MQIYKVPAYDTLRFEFYDILTVINVPPISLIAFLWFIKFYNLLENLEKIHLHKEESSEYFIKELKIVSSIYMHIKSNWLDFRII